MISIVVPVYNEQEALPLLFERLSVVGPTLGDAYEVVVVNDGSSDSTAAQLKLIHEQDDRWKVLSFSRNFGHQAAISAGLYYSRGDAVVVMDADLQDPPEVLERLLTKWREGYEVVYAIRTNRKENVLLRMTYKLFYSILHRIASINIPLDAGDFCLMDRRVVDVLNVMPERAKFLRGLRCWVGLRHIGVEYDRQERQAGRSKYTLPRLIRLALDGILSFSVSPLRLSSWCGIGLCGASVSLVILIVIWWLTDVTVWGMRPSHSVGWTSIVSLILLLSGLQMMMIGVLGEYVARVFDETKGRPPWIISGAMGFDDVSYGTQPGWFVRPNPRGGTPK